MELDLKLITKAIALELKRHSGMAQLVNNLRWQHYIKTNHITWGIPTAIQRRVSKLGIPGITENDEQTKWKIWSAVYKQSNIFEHKNLALYFAESFKKKRFDASRVTELISWVDYTDNWAHSDAISSILSCMLEFEEQIFLKQLRLWNKSPNQWHRRQSVVCLFYYSRTRKQFFSFESCEELFCNLLDDDKYYVQKGLGWALREASHVYYDLTLDFISRHIHRFKPTAYTAAIEKLQEKDRIVIAAMRKKNPPDLGGFTVW